MRRISNLKFKISNYGKGFSLVELLIVISIIAVLSALIFGSLYVIPRMRDAQRKSDLYKIQQALEQYKADQGLYPPYGFWSGGCGAFSIQSGGKVYLDESPCDPIGSSYWNWGWYFTWSSDPISNPPSRYVIAACLENANDNSPETTNQIPVAGAPTGCPSGKYFVLKSQ